MSDPWLKFYPTDWRSDPALRMCSLAARGLWIEMIALMHEAATYGHLLVSNRPPTDAQLAVLVGTSSDKITGLLGELDAAGVFSRTKEGVIYSRKMVRDAKKAAIARKNGKRGGNPSLCTDKGNPPSDKGRDKGQDKPQKPEARSQSKKESANALSARSCRFQDFWDAYPHRDGVKKNRKGAEDRYRAAIKAGVPEADIISAAVRYQTDPQVARGYSRDPTTWLNQRGWEDEPAVNVHPFPSNPGGPNVSPRQDREAAAADAFRRRHIAAATASRTPPATFDDY